MATPSSIHASYFIQRIEHALDGLPESERRVMALACSDPKAFLDMSAEQASLRAKVSKPTVVRACRRVGYEGLTEFKRHLVLYLGSSSHDLPYVNYSLKHQDDIENLGANLSSNLISAIDAFRKSAGFGSIQQAAQAINAALDRHGHVLLMGVGNSGIVATDAQHKFYHLGVNCTVCQDTDQQVITATMAQPQDCLIAFSTSGRTADLVHAAQIAKKGKVKIVAVTKTGSPLAQVADVVIPVEHDEDSNLALPMVSRVLQLLVVDILVMAVATKRSPHLAPQLKALEKNIKHKRGHL
ncbi:MurR/RpiR family transcriptional regulator [Rhodoferax saidenbachensis]|uniref:RpiR family carbohydrate utilization transcriptional regulator n=1 Tax=Rhodoferax saidenbachensis TaxID=1484693 RepID=A0ABU1ZMP6_9BURK|nr:MurR/RpiR family transcriptional regulator [Rhodoferax saidenbachensis]MDR7306809.1 RpiR family carbohydrate utilization transcriptional regulator [Rhodoferax saidenbachensis]